MADWFIHHDDDTEIGPLTPKELLDLVRSGAISEDTMCRKENSAWHRVGDVGGLMKAAQGQVVGYRCPHCRKTVSEPPTYCRGCKKYLDSASEIVRDSDGKTHAADADKIETPRETLSSWANWVTRLREQRERRLRGEEPPPSSDNEDDVR